MAKDEDDLIFFINVYHKLTCDILVGGSVAQRLEHWNCDLQTMSSIPTVTGSPEFSSSVMLVYSNLVCFWPIEILSLLGNNEYY